MQSLPSQTSYSPRKGHSVITEPAEPRQRLSRPQRSSSLPIEDYLPLAPTPPLFSPSLLSLPRSLAPSLARSLSCACSAAQSSTAALGKWQSSRETDRALLLISQGENLQACECRQHSHMHMLLTNAGDDPAHKKSDLCRRRLRRDPTSWTRSKEVLRRSSQEKSGVPKITPAFWE